jgi:hypothetical protein
MVAFLATLAEHFLGEQPREMISQGANLTESAILSIRSGSLVRLVDMKNA